MDKLSNELGIILPKGANPQVDEAAKKIVSKYGKVSDNYKKYYAGGQTKIFYI